MDERPLRPPALLDGVDLLDRADLLSVGIDERTPAEVVCLGESGHESSLVWTIASWRGRQRSGTRCPGATDRAGTASGSGSDEHRPCGDVENLGPRAST